MLVKLKRCLKCDALFAPRTYKHLFCCRKCYITTYRSKMKEEKYPSYVCQLCGTRIQLNFYPKINFKKWELLKCTKCNHKREKQTSL